jgi:O-Antigen ligase
MARARSAAAVLPALLPGLVLLLLGFQAGGFFPDAWAPLTLVLAVALALRVATVERPFAGVSVWSGVALGALALLGVWMLASASWSDAPGRATVEFVRLLLYGLVLALCASLAPREGRLAWALRGLLLATAVICIAGLITRLRPDVWSQTGLLAGRLDFPITYWNGMGLLAGVGIVLALHLSSSLREPWLSRVVAAGFVPVAACTLYFTLSRGGIGVAAIGVVVYLVCGFSRGTPGALLAIVPPTAIAVQRAYDAERLVTPQYADAAGRAEGREVVAALLIAVAAALVLRAAALLVDRVARGAPSLGQLSGRVRVALALLVVLAGAGVAVAAGAPQYVERQAERFVEAPPLENDRSRLTSLSSNGRVDNWEVALEAWRTERLHGTGAGTYANEWNLRRDYLDQVLDAHSLYLEAMADLGLVGLALVLALVAAVLGGLAWRLRGDDRPAYAAALAAAIAWAVHAGADWDWELTAVSVWLFGLAGIALARRGEAAAGWAPPRVLRLIAALCCLGLALMPFALWRSQEDLQAAARAFDRGDCGTTIDAALDSLAALSARAEPWELVAYCDVRLGQPELAEDAARAAIARDPGNWEYHYALALVLGAARKDPRAAAAEARRLNPLEPRTIRAVRAFDTDRPAVWERRARRLPLYLG